MIFGPVPPRIFYAAVGEEHRAGRRFNLFVCAIDDFHDSMNPNVYSSPFDVPVAAFPFFGIVVERSAIPPGLSGVLGLGRKGGKVFRG